MPLSFEQFKSLRSQGLNVDQITRFEKGEKPQTGFLGGIKQDIGTRAMELQKGFERQERGQQTGLETGLQTLGQGAGLGFDIVGRAIGAVTPEFIQKPLQAGAEAIAGTKPVQEVTQAYKTFREKHPRAAADLEAITNIGSFIPAVRGISEVGKLATGGVRSISQSVLESVGPKAQNLARSLEESSLKLTPAKREALGGKLHEITDYISQNIPVGNPETRYQAAKLLNNKTEEKLQRFLSTQAKESFVSKKQLLRDLDNIKKDYVGERDSKTIARQIDGAKQVIQEDFKGEKITVAQLNKFKRSTYQSAYNKTGDKILDYVEFDIGDRTRQAIENATKGLTIDGQDVGVFNKEYGKLINATKLLRTARTRTQLGFTGKIVSKIIGGLLGTPLGLPGEVGGFLIGEPIGTAIAGTESKVRAAKFLRGIGDKLPK